MDWFFVRSKKVDNKLFKGNGKNFSIVMTSHIYNHILYNTTIAKSYTKAIQKATKYQKKYYRL